MKKENVQSKVLIIFLIGVIFFPIAARTESQKETAITDLVSPVFGFAIKSNGNFIVADAGAGIVKLDNGETTLLAPLPAVTDVAPITGNKMFAVTGKAPIPTAQKLFRVTHGEAEQIADLLAFETAVNPDGQLIDSNPFDVEALTKSKALVADAGGNDLLIVDKQGNVDWIATLPNQLVSTDFAKQLAGCPNPPPGLEFICGLPPILPAQGVATSIAVGPDGAYYVGELTGFPAQPGVSRIWRIEPNTLHATCGTSSACTVVASGFTSIVDLAFDSNNTLYVVELDENSWMAVEFGLTMVGGTVNACDSTSWTCTAVATGLPMVMAAAVDQHDNLFAVINALVPGSVQIVPVP
jgi:hypothetical protein